MKGDTDILPVRPIGHNTINFNEKGLIMADHQISVQLYSLREALGKDLAGTLGKLSATGFRYVEPAGYCGLTAAEFARELEKAGLQAPSIHGALPVGDDCERIIEEAQALGVRYLITGGPAGGWDSWKTSDSIRQQAELYSQAAANAAPHGIKVGFHNHDMEMQEIDGEPAYRIFLAAAAPEVLWTVDTYWVQVGGRNPVEVIREAGSRSKVVHIKDGPGVKGQPMLAAGEGVMDFPPIIAAAEHAEYLCIELDSCATDMMEAVVKSFRYLQQQIED